MWIRKFLAVLALLPVFSLPLSGHAYPAYTVHVLPTGFLPVDINNAGLIAGNADGPGGQVHAVLYDNGSMIGLDTFGATSSYAYALNDAGAVTGFYIQSPGSSGAFLYQNGTMAAIGANMQGRAINAHGDVAGIRSDFTTLTSTGFVYRDGAVTVLNNLGTGDYGMATGINDHGDVVGESTIIAEPAHPPQHPFLYRDGQLFDLGTLANQELNGATGINNAGQIAGYSVVATQEWHAFRYEDGVMTDLGSFGGRYLEVSDLNEHGTLVGTARAPDDALIPFRSIGNSLVDLNTLIDPALGWHIDSAYANNDIGQILAHGCRGDVCSAVRLDLANAIPEPGAALLLLPGLLLLAGVQRRQRDVPLPIPG